MSKIVIKKFPYTPFSIECSEVENGPGVWNSTKVSIYRDDKLIGEYIRNYANYGALTFYPFKQGDQWYALYSAKYTATRVMKLHDDRIEDWCGEESSCNGFCPVEYYIPRLVTTVESYTIDGVTSTDDCHFIDCDYSENGFQAEANSSNLKSNENLDFALLCGCVWGDDSSWKIRHIDLRKVSDKILPITEKFGYWEMAKNLTLKQSVSMDAWEPGYNWISLIKSEYINLDK